MKLDKEKQYYQKQKIQIMTDKPRKISFIIDTIQIGNLEYTMQSIFWQIFNSIQIGVNRVLILQSGHRQVLHS